WLVRRSYASGYPDGSFRPAGSITRAQAVQWIWNRWGRPSGADEPFDDVHAGHWAGVAIGWAADSGVVSGYPDGSFRPEDPVTRAQFVRMLWVASGSPEPAGASPYPDTPAWSADAISWAAEHGIVRGYPDGSFRPNDPISRAAASRMLHQHAIDH
ncbi:MAG: S-layer homology domain-containing protein, partial [Actinomycetota bacterium]